MTIERIHDPVAEASGQAPRYRRDPEFWDAAKEWMLRDCTNKREASERWEREMTMMNKQGEESETEAAIRATVRGEPMFSLDERLSKGALKPSPVNHPPHYTSHPSGIECIDITEHMSFCLGNVLKYVWRSDMKGNAIEDLEKARWYLDREIALRKRQKKED